MTNDLVSLPPTASVVAYSVARPSANRFQWSTGLVDTTMVDDNTGPLEFPPLAGADSIWIGLYAWPVALFCEVDILHHPTCLHG